MENLPGFDRDNLTKKAYDTDESYKTRTRIHDLYSIPKVDFVDWVLARYDWHGNEHILDLGSGPGLYFEQVRARLPRGRLVGADLSIGMARKAKKAGDADLVVNADAQDLPFKKRTFDVILANHMLFHVPDIDQALHEIHRLLKPTGSLIASTNSRDTMPELEQLIRYSYSLLGARNVDIDARPYHFYLEDGTMHLSRHFFAVARHDLSTAFVFPSAQPAIDYVNSTRALRESLLPPGIHWDDFISVLGNQIQRRINHFGEWVVNKLSGVLIATDAGGFVNDYVNRIIISKRK